jgi:hypothetical protein
MLHVQTWKRKRKNNFEARDISNVKEANMIGSPL